MFLFFLRAEAPERLLIFVTSAFGRLTKLSNIKMDFHIGRWVFDDAVVSDDDGGVCSYDDPCLLHSVDVLCGMLDLFDCCLIGGSASHQYGIGLIEQGRRSKKANQTNKPSLRTRWIYDIALFFRIHNRHHNTTIRSPSTTTGIEFQSNNL